MSLRVPCRGCSRCGVNCHGEAVTCSNPAVPVLRSSKGTCRRAGVTGSAPAVGTAMAQATGRKTGTFERRVETGEKEGSKAVLFLDSGEEMWHFKGFTTATNSLQVQAVIRVRAECGSGTPNSSCLTSRKRRLSCPGRNRGCLGPQRL